MAIIPFVNIQWIVVIVVVMLTLDMIGYMTKIGVFYIAAGVLGLYLDGAIFANSGGITYQTNCILGPATQTCFTVQSDPNLPAVLVAVLTIMSFYFVYWEKQFSG